jgi:hypothetical protein
MEGRRQSFLDNNIAQFGRRRANLGMLQSNQEGTPETNRVGDSAPCRVQRKLSLEQEQLGREIEANCGGYIVARSLDDVQSAGL